MCGIAGFIYVEICSNDFKKQITKKINNSLAHRGPNDEGCYIDNETNLTLSHTRLSVIDLSSGGSQPMVSSSGRYIISYNGELYNYKELKLELMNNSFKFKTESDTEVLLSSIEQWGLEVGLKKMEGMFAFALYDKKLKQLSLVRDRFGEKPLYYGWLKDDLVFGSELKSLKFHKNWSGEIDTNAINLYLKYSYVPSPYSIYKDIYKLEPGTFISFQIAEKKCKKIKQKKWYTIDKKGSELLDISYREAQDNLEKLLISSVQKQKVSDVPIGSLLSGGVDSSLVSSLMQRDSIKKINTFTVGYNEKIYDESRFAKKIANHIGSNHHEWIINKNEIIDYIPSLPQFYDEPFADSSQLPTLLISKFASQKVTVCLTGDAGDELFGGYNRYIYGPKIYSYIKNYPGTVKVTTRLLEILKPYKWKTFFSILQEIIPDKYSVVNPTEKLYKLNEVLNCKSEYEIYDKLVSTWNYNILINSDLNKKNETKDKKFLGRASNFAERMMIEDINSYLTDDILVKVDRASMANSLETRVPFLSEKIVSLSCKIPIEMKISSNGQGKRILRDILNKYIPKKIVDRPKAGFGIPIDDWLRTTLKDWANDHICEQKIKNQGYFDYNQIKKVWETHQKKESNNHHQIWNILMFQSWLEKEKN